ncbi:MAG: hypothetical protein RJA35_1285 [Actinomycetota bacterium]|jgi:hypothetical protein
MSEFNTSKSAPLNRAQTGPFDVSEVSSLANYGDFGSIKVVPLEGMEIRLEIEEGTQRVVAVSIALNQSTLQLQAFAAPKSEGLWNEVRQEIGQSIRAQGGLLEERIGAFGPELLAQLPNTDPSDTTRRFSRFVGIDGPRWFLRGVIGGAAINDPAAANQIESVLKAVVVDRGPAAVPPRDLLDLHIPSGVVAPTKTMLGEMFS